VVRVAPTRNPGRRLIGPGFRRRSTRATRLAEAPYLIAALPELPRLLRNLLLGAIAVLLAVAVALLVLRPG